MRDVLQISKRWFFIQYVPNTSIIVMEKESNVMGEISENPLAGKITSLLESNGAAKRSKYPIVFENLSVIGSGNKV
jgi:ABC-type enterochelin transport system ATPase subunit